MESRNYDLFKFFSDRYNLTLLESEMNDIIDAVKTLALSAPSIDAAAGEGKLNIMDIPEVQSALRNHEKKEDVVLPIEYECLERIMKGNPTYLDHFICNHQPRDINEAYTFREQLINVLNELKFNLKHKDL